MQPSRMKRIPRHLFYPRWLTARAFPGPVMARIAKAVAESEQGHACEIRFVVEGALDFVPLVRRQTARERALEVFSSLYVWDTEANNGVLVYLLLADRDVEILADRGFNGRVEWSEWKEICAEMQAHFARGDFEQGTLAGIARIDALARRHFPLAGGVNPNELPDAPAVL